MAANGRVSPTANGFHEPIEVHEAANNDVNLNVFEMEGRQLFLISVDFYLLSFFCMKIVLLG